MRFKALLSFHYYGKVDLSALAARLTLDEPPLFFADSGAFSARTQGAPITLQDYAAWVQEWEPLLVAYANLDVIGDEKATLRNQGRMEAKGLRPLPVFHGGSRWPVLERYLREHDYIALGGMVGAPAAKKAWLVQAFKRAQGRAVYHGFGMTQWSVLRDFPFYTVDSSSWGSAYRYGSLQLFDRGRWVKARIGTTEPYRHARLLREHGGDPADFADRSRYHRSLAARVAAVAWMRAEAWLLERHHVDPPASYVDRMRDGGGLFLAESNPEHLEFGAEGARGIYLADSARGSHLDHGARGARGVYLADSTAQHLTFAAKAMRDDVRGVYHSLGYTDHNTMANLTEPFVRGFGEGGG